MTASPARLILETVDSTNAEATRRAAAGEPGPLWILAHTQTAARARRGRHWTCQPGNLFATLLIRPAVQPRRAALLTFAASLAVAEVATALAPSAEVALKWPNDVLVEGRKVAGILLESAGTAERLDWLAIGIGVNLVGAPRDIKIRPGGTPPISLTEAGAPPTTPEAALDHLATALARWLAAFEAEGFAPVRTAWLARAAHLGARIGAGLPGETLEGRFETVDDDGNLVLHTASGRRRVAAADVFFPE